MPIRLSNIRMSIDEPELELALRAAAALGVRPREVESVGFQLVAT